MNSGIHDLRFTIYAERSRSALVSSELPCPLPEGEGMLASFLYIQP